MPMLGFAAAGADAVTPLYDDFSDTVLNTGKWATYVNNGNAPPFIDGGVCKCQIPVGGNGYACAIRSLTPISTSGIVIVKWRQRFGSHYLGGYGRPRVSITSNSSINRNTYYGFPGGNEALAVQFGSSAEDDATNRRLIGGGTIYNDGLPAHGTDGAYVIDNFPINTDYDCEWVLDFTNTAQSFYLNGTPLWTDVPWYATFGPFTQDYFLEFGNYQYGGGAYIETFDNIYFTGASA